MRGPGPVGVGSRGEGAARWVVLRRLWLECHRQLCGALLPPSCPPTALSMEWLECRHKVALAGVDLHALGDRATMAGLDARRKTLEKQFKRMHFLSNITAEQLQGCLERYLRTVGDVEPKEEEEQQQQQQQQ